MQLLSSQRGMVLRGQRLVLVGWAQDTAGGGGECSLESPFLCVSLGWVKIFQFFSFHVHSTYKGCGTSLDEHQVGGGYRWSCRSSCGDLAQRDAATWYLDTPENHSPWPLRGATDNPHPCFLKEGVWQNSPAGIVWATSGNSHGLKVSKILPSLPLVSKPPKCHVQICGWHNTDFYTVRGIACSLDTLGYLLTTWGVSNSVYLSS